MNGEEIYAFTGDVVFAPRGSVHTLQNIGSEPGRTLTSSVPGGLDEFFEDLERAATRGSVPNPVELMPVFEKHRQELLGPPLAVRASSGK